MRSRNNSSTNSNPSAYSKSNSRNSSPTRPGDPALEHNLSALGFDEHKNSIKTEHPEAHAALVITEALRERTRYLNAISTHGERLSRQLERTLLRLKNLQSERRATGAQQLAEAAALFQMDQKQGLTYNPSEDGFVFSNSEIETYIRRRDRLKAALAYA